MNARFFPALLCAALATIAGTAHADVISNGNFANGFAGWTLSGDVSYVSYGQAQGQFTGENGAPLGNAAYLGTAVGEGDLSQTLTTVAGQSYDLTFVLQSDTGTVAPDYFTTYINGVADANLSVSNIGQVDWSQYSDVFTATGTSTTLEFAFRNDPAYFELTNVSIPEPATLVTFVAGLAGLVMMIRRRNTFAG